MLLLLNAWIMESQKTPEYSETKQRPMRIGLLGASFDTGNLGVNALAESSIKIILNYWPDAEITLLDSGRVVSEEQLRIGDRNLCIKKRPIRFSSNIFLENHFVVLCFYAFLFKVFRWERFRRFCARRNASLRCMVRTDMVADITGGDSFSDIYGMRRFVLGFLRKWLVLFFSKRLILLPQTYGPYKRRLTRRMARYVLNNASLIYSRDKAGIKYVNKLLNGNADKNKVRLAPDVAFVLDSRKPARIRVEPSLNMRTKESMLVGLNISGLLFNGGYNQNNMFGLKCNYVELVHAVIEMLLKDEKIVILLVPHVFPPPGCEVESDPVACLKVYEAGREKYRDRLFLLRGEYNQNEIKYIIGMCDFFVGSRMHACIAALSQRVPAVGIAYSKKFDGVFESIGLPDCVVDARRSDENIILQNVKAVFNRRDEIRKHLQDVMPRIKSHILSIYDIPNLREL